MTHHLAATSPPRLTRRALVGGAALLPAALLLRPAAAAEPHVFQEGGVAIRGADPVAYFLQGRAVIGSADHQAQHDGATWRFASTENAARFGADPGAYAPRYGGYCAWAMAEGYLAAIDPEAWTIHEGALYLNANGRIRRRWERDIPGFIAAADANWPGILG